MLIQSSEFRRHFKKLPQKIKDRAIERLRIFVDDEYNYFLNNHELSGKYKEYRSINVNGDYRIVFKKTGDSICLVDVGTHSQLYE